MTRLSRLVFARIAAGLGLAACGRGWYGPLGSAAPPRLGIPTPCDGLLSLL